METQLAVTQQQALAPANELSVDDLLSQVKKVQQVMAKVMKPDEHYGIIPGCKKPSLYKPGAEKLGFTFRLMPRFQIQRLDLAGGHREYIVTCELYHVHTGEFVGSGVGSCSSMEAKYRYRAGKVFTGEPVPKEYWDAKRNGAERDALQKMIGGAGFGVGKNPDGQWEICTVTDEKIEYDNPADYFNTILKMAKKRAHVDAILTATAASDIFTQDVEDLRENDAANGDGGNGKPKQAKPVQSTVKGKGKEPTGEDADRAELARICMEVAEAGKDVVTQDFASYEFVDAADIASVELLAQGICVTLGSFISTKGQRVKGEMPEKLSGKHLQLALRNARAVEQLLTVVEEQSA